MIHLQAAPALGYSDADSCLGTASMSDIRYKCFPGDLLIRIGGGDFSTDWGWVPILDAALGLKYVLETLRSDGEIRTFEFTESESTINFTREEDTVHVSASYTSAVATVGYVELKTALDDFAVDVRSQVVSRYPTIETNENFLALFK